MRDEIAVRFDGVQKSFRLFSGPGEMAMSLLGIERFFRRSAQNRPEYPALNGVSFEVRRGERVGLIGRNGAGKSTLVRLITGNSIPTAGSVTVNGRIQALLDAGVGFHPDFTGSENIRAALVYNALTPDEQRKAFDEIVEFVELGDYLHQPFRTYSLGMQARLGFATATAIKPEILLIDEILSAGDAYFAIKCSDRMKALTSKGVTLLLVSHSTQQIVQFCDRAIWLDRGKIVDDGNALEVVKKYEAYIRDLDESRLQQENSTAVSRQRVQEIADKRAEAESETFGLESKPSLTSSAAEVIGPSHHAAPPSRAISRWRGSAELSLRNLIMYDRDGRQCWQFKAMDPVTFEVNFECTISGTYGCTFEVYVYTLDSRALSMHLSKSVTLSMSAGQVGRIRLHYTELLLGNGDYVVTVALHKVIDLVHVETSARYDLLDRSFQFRVFGKPAGDTALFAHPGEWGPVEILGAAERLPSAIEVER